jgi:hypothetical protein
LSKEKEKEKLSLWVADHPLSHPNKKHKEWCNHPPYTLVEVAGHPMGGHFILPKSKK